MWRHLRPVHAQEHVATAWDILSCICIQAVAELQKAKLARPAARRRWRWCRRMRHLRLRAKMAKTQVSRKLQMTLMRTCQVCNLSPVEEGNHCSSSWRAVHASLHAGWKLGMPGYEGGRRVEACDRAACAWCCAEAEPGSGDEEGAPDAAQAAAEPDQALPEVQELPLPASTREALLQEWEGLTAVAEALRPIERYRVVSVAYRR